MNINKMIDHTLLKPEANEAALLTLIEEAKKYEFASVCVNPYWVALASKKLAGTSVAICTVIGFPLGANTTATKAFETEEAIKNGATEVDMVINVGALKSGDEATVLKDIEAVVKVAKDKALVKVILETCLLNDREIAIASKLSVQAGADFVKTSTGFSTGGATIKDVALMRKTVGPEVGVKASGGVRTAEDAKSMIHAGASRLGASSSIAIVDAAIEDTTEGY
ncbi:deoxyribose-phosphate aldolase [Enterococcus moraviensis ATCC BAA-383]|uniref:Deoxyribose-phosphate aldolase n=1 Tax=Enterococcus moraviensis ATCC BAA-383 TaxID=1158609 RepID=R2TNB1_9ENTE|nr:deoxyribose-phosphate aldolase [Enterococcus moraviensis]EOI01642.1 deoxyribose-phosphate aldolase [Enterococcus moraviensis ATCC BAA-383]EOT73823.1 deoxyribose-phosphate aldolase [Enterococcus moraviensis ATCC BAA-383]OJG65143.1 deoxyribose-phosphate aldolase [Enterococcus moraviensis]